jgi:aminopeptidase YwaD
MTGDDLSTQQQTAASAGAAMRHVRELCALGDRFAGQPGDRPAADYVAQVLGALDYIIELVEVPATSWREDHCRVLLHDGTALEAAAPFFGPGTEGPLTAELVWTDRDALEARDIGGRIVCFPTEAGYGLFWLGGLADELRRRGALGLVLAHSMPWAYRPTMESGLGALDRRFADPRLPVAVLSCNGAMALSRALGAGEATVTLDIATETSRCESQCVVGLRPGSALEQERVVVLAHRDHACPPGANDNGSGTATMLEVARLLAGERHERSIAVLSVASEESAGAGSGRYLEALGDGVRNLVASISLDMIAAGGPLKVVESAYWPDLGRLDHTAWLNDMLIDEAERQGLSLQRMQGDWGAADSGRFLARGVPAAWLWKPDDLKYHSEHDTVDSVDPNALKVAADIVAAAVRRLADEPLPSGSPR